MLLRLTLVDGTTHERDASLVRVYGYGIGVVDDETDESETVFPWHRIASYERIGKPSRPTGLAVPQAVRGAVPLGFDG